MILARLADWRRYTALAELREAFAFLERHAGGGLKPGRIEIAGDRVFALPQSYAPKPVAEGRFEAHRRYLDVQYIASGAEMIGWAPTPQLEAETPYHPEQDIAFYRVPARYTPLALVAGVFAVFYPEDAHMPCLELGGQGQVEKIVVKVALG